MHFWICCEKSDFTNRSNGSWLMLVKIIKKKEENGQKSISVFFQCPQQFITCEQMVADIYEKCTGEVFLTHWSSGYFLLLHKIQKHHIHSGRAGWHHCCGWLALPSQKGLIGEKKDKKRQNLLTRVTITVYSWLTISNNLHTRTNDQVT